MVTIFYGVSLVNYNWLRFLAHWEVKLYEPLIRMLTHKRAQMEMTMWWSFIVVVMKKRENRGLNDCKRGGSDLFIVYWRGLEIEYITLLSFQIKYITTPPHVLKHALPSFLILKRSTLVSSQYHQTKSSRSKLIFFRFFLLC